MECKWNTLDVLTTILNEIIETYWNVNKRFLKTKKKKISEIIETYWNVNSKNTGGQEADENTK